MTIEEKINAVIEPLADGAAVLTVATCEFGFTFEEAFPATIVRTVRIDGKLYKAVMELELTPIGE